MSVELLQLLAVGLAAGGLGALLGVGGGVILVPGLIFVSGLPFQQAVAASLVCVVGTSVAGSSVYLRQDRVEVPVAVELQFFTVVGAVGAGLVAAFVPAGPLYFAFALLLLLTAHRMWPWRRAPAHSGSGFTGRRRGAARGASVGSGVVSGLLGVGGGVLNVPILHLLVGMPFERAVATSVYIIGLTAAAGAAVYVARGDVRLWIAAAALLGTLLGAGIAALVARRFDARFLKAGFVVLLLYVAVRMVSRGVAQF